MLKSITAIIFLFYCLQGTAQSKHFMLVENKTNQNVMLKCNDEVYELSFNNFKIIPKLNIGTYVVDVFFQGKIVNSFKVEILNFDRGFELIKKDEDFVLKEINSKETIVDSRNEKSKTIDNTVSQQVNESETNKPVETVIAVVDKDIKLIFNKNNKDGIDQIYVDGKDTIAIYIPNEVERQSVKITKPDDKKELVNDIQQSILKSESLTNKNCKQIAEEIDVKTATEKILEAASIKDKIKVANVFFKTKCFSCNQIRRMSVLFGSDLNKFSMFKLAQPYITDIQNFETLADELKDERVIEEFKEFVKQL